MQIPRFQATKSDFRDDNVSNSTETRENLCAAKKTQSIHK